MVVAADWVIRTTAFACRYKNKLGVIDLTMRGGSRLPQAPFGFLTLIRVLDGWISGL
jgi:hypothetical protein